MAEEWVSTKAGAHLAGRRKTDTVPEVLLRKALHAQGARFRLHRRLAPACTPDIVLPGRRIAVFVDGDYWHSCPQHGRKIPFTGPNAKLWEAKLQRTKDRDRAATATAQRLGWTVVRLWECQVRANPARAAETVIGASACASPMQG